MEACKRSRTFRGMSKPQCDQGRGCKACWEIYNRVQEQIPTMAGIKAGDVVYCIPDRVRNPHFAGCFLTVTESRGGSHVFGFVQLVGDAGEPGERCWYQGRTDEFIPVCRAPEMLPDLSKHVRLDSWTITEKGMVANAAG